MKRTLVIFVALLLVLTMVACSTKEELRTDDQQNTIEVKGAVIEQQNQMEAKEETSKQQSQATPSETVNEQQDQKEVKDDNESEQQGHAEINDTASADGYTVKIIAVHKTVDSNGDPLGVVELKFTNENEEAMSFMSIVDVKMFQSGIECYTDQLYLEDDYDWNTQYLEIKNGATINVFVPLPLRSNEDPVEVEAILYDITRWNRLAQASITTFLE